MAENTVSKQRGRPFRKGQSGNPAGKPKGAINKATRAAMVLLDGEGEALTRKAVELALAGDTTALRLCLERIVPARKDRPVSVQLPKIETTGDTAKVLSAILDSVACGDLTPSEGQLLSSMTETYRRAVETAELERRLSELETRSKKR